jgi:hypothetical protein
MGQPEIHADEDDGAFYPGDQFRQADSDMKKRGGRTAAPRADQAAVSSFSAAEKLTARPGTMVEMACL